MQAAPTKLDSVAGKFWLPESPKDSVYGFLSTGDGWPKLRIAGELMPTMKAARKGEGFISYEPAPMSIKDGVIHGILANGIGRVTLFGIFFSQRNSPLFGKGVSEQILTSDILALGDNLEFEELKFSKFRFSIEKLGLWSALTGVSTSIDLKSGKYGIKYEPRDRETVETPNLDGSFTFDHKASFSTLTHSGAGVSTSTWAIFTGNESITFSEFRQKIEFPLLNLLTFLFDDFCGPGKFEAQISGSPRSHWVELIVNNRGFNEAKGSEHPLLCLDDLGTVTTVGAIAELSRLSPFPDIVANSIRRNNSLEGNFVQLAFAAEGLHRKLFPEFRHFTPEEAAPVIKAIKESNGNKKVTERVASAAKQYLGELSFPQRLAHLAEISENIAPGITGKTSKWKQAIVNLRNDLAHGLPADSIEERFTRIEVLTLSLKWVLVLCILNKSGIPQEKLASGLVDSVRYDEFIGAAKDHLTDVYGEA